MFKGYSPVTPDINSVKCICVEILIKVYGSLYIIYIYIYLLKFTNYHFSQG